MKIPSSWIRTERQGKGTLVKYVPDNPLPAFWKMPPEEGFLEHQTLIDSRKEQFFVKMGYALYRHGNGELEVFWSVSSRCLVGLDRYSMEGKFFKVQDPESEEVPSDSSQ